MSIQTVLDRLNKEFSPHVFTAVPAVKIEGVVVPMPAERYDTIFGGEPIPYYSILRDGERTKAIYQVDVEEHLQRFHKDIDADLELQELYVQFFKYEEEHAQ